MADSSLNRVSDRVLKKPPYGYALYESESSLVLKPGTCGYLTEKGAWTPLLDLSNADEVRTCGFTLFDSIKRVPTTSRFWGPKLSDIVTRVAFWGVTSQVW